MGIVTAILLHITLIFLVTSYSFDICRYWIYTSALHSLLESSDCATFPAWILPHLSFSSTLPILMNLSPVFFCLHLFASDIIVRPVCLLFYTRVIPRYPSSYTNLTGSSKWVPRRAEQVRGTAPPWTLGAWWVFRGWTGRKGNGVYSTYCIHLKGSVQRKLR